MTAKGKKVCGGALVDCKFSRANRQTSSSWTSKRGSKRHRDQLPLLLAAGELKHAIRQVRLIADGPRGAVAPIKALVESGGYRFDYLCIARMMIMSYLIDDLA
jgi:hypothetical protein